MFSKKITGLLGRCDISSLDVPTLRDIQTENRVQTAMARADEHMSFGQRMLNPREWTRLQRLRREDLLALLFSAPAQEYNQRILDIICDICEEADWCDISLGEPLQDMSHPVIDLPAAETACLLGWAVLCLGRRNDARYARIAVRVLHEVRRRIISPILSHEDYGWMHPGTPGAPGIICAATTAAILLETDLSRRNAALRRLLRLLDDACPAIDASISPMSMLIADACAVTDLVGILNRISHSCMDLTPLIPCNPWLDTVLAAHAGSSMFFDPCGEGVQPVVSGKDIYRLGVAGEDDALRSLGALLDRASAVPSCSVNGALLSAAQATQMARETGHVPRLRHAKVPGMATALGAGFLSALYGGARYGNAGNWVVLLEDKLLLADTGAQCSVQNLPVICGQNPVTCPTVPEMDCDLGRERTVISLDLTACYPAGAGLRSYQRTLITDRVQACVRLIDAVSLPEGGAVCFRFVTAVHPQISRDGMGLGNAWLSWPGEPHLRCEPLYMPGCSGRWLVCLEYDHAPGRELYSFELERT